MIAPTTQTKNPNRGQRIKTASKQYFQKRNNYEKLINQSQCEPCGLETVDLYQNVAILDATMPLAGRCVDEYPHLSISKVQVNNMKPHS